MPFADLTELSRLNDAVLTISTELRDVSVRLDSKRHQAGSIHQDEYLIRVCLGAAVLSASGTIDCWRAIHRVISTEGQMIGSQSLFSLSRQMLESALMARWLALDSSVMSLRDKGMLCAVYRFRQWEQMLIFLEMVDKPFAQEMRAQLPPDFMAQQKVAIQEHLAFLNIDDSTSLYLPKGQSWPKMDYLLVDALDEDGQQGDLRWLYHPLSGVAHSHEWAQDLFSLHKVNVETMTGELVRMTFHRPDYPLVLLASQCSIRNLQDALQRIRAGAASLDR